MIVYSLRSDCTKVSLFNLIGCNFHTFGVQKKSESVSNREHSCSFIFTTGIQSGHNRSYF
jgi:hypothetical protein